MSEVTTSATLSIIIPAKNEAAAIADVVAIARAEYPHAEVIVVDDGSTDDTGALAERAGATVIRHPESLGNGASVKSGARAASGEILAFMDGDGQHDARELGILLGKLDEGYQMAVGARDSGSHANVGRQFANGVYNEIASRLTGRRILDLTSGFRAVRASLFKQFLYLLPNGFSYPTTITMAFLRSGYPVCFAVRQGRGQKRQEPYPPDSRWRAIPGHYFQDRDAVFAAENLPADQRSVFSDRPQLLRLHVLFFWALYQYERVAVERCRDHIPDRSYL